MTRETNSAILGGKGGDLTSRETAVMDADVRNEVRIVGLTLTDVARFWSRIEVRQEDQCWPWRWSLNSGGYGEFRIGTIAHPAPRVAWMLSNGPIPDGMVIRHTCDNPACCNWQHLELGTHQDNVRDRVGRNRSARGITNGRAKMEEDWVRHVRQSKLGDRFLAAQYDVHEDTIRAIRAGKTWRHLLPVNSPESQ